MTKADDAALTKWISTTELLLTTKTTACVASKVVQITCPNAQLAANPAAGDIQFQVKTSADSTYTTLATGYAVVAAASPTWTSALPNTLCATSTPTSLVLKFKPNTKGANAGTVKLTADKEIFAADAATTCTAKEISTATGVATAVAVNSAAVTGTKKILTVTSAAKLAVLGHEVEVTCTSNLAPITAKDDVVKFSLETSGDTTGITTQTGYTAIAACPVTFGGAARTKSLVTLKTTADAGDLVVWFTPATEIPGGGDITIKVGTAIATAAANTLCVTKCNDGATTMTKADD